MKAMYDKLKSLRWYIIYDWSVKAAFEWFLMEMENERIVDVKKIIAY